MWIGSRRRLGWIAAGGGVLLAVVMVAWVGVVAWGNQSRPSTQASGTVFYAVVVDQDGAAVVDASFRGRVTRLGRNPIIAGGMVPSIEDARMVTVMSDAEGKIVVTLNDKENVLDGCEVSKEGYVEVTDWAWTLPFAYARGQNRMFEFRDYRPDQSRPARYVLHRIDQQHKVAGSPSRGGWDRQRDGTYRGNDPLEPLIPSYGKGAPLNKDEVNRRLRALPPSDDPLSPRYSDTRPTSR